MCKYFNVFICIIIKTYYFNAGYNMRFFIYANICLALFNMLPILPLDGGRILKTFLFQKWSCQGMQIYKKTVFDIFGFAFGSWNFQYIISKYNFSILLIAGYMLYFQKATDRRRY